MVTYVLNESTLLMLEQLEAQGVTTHAQCRAGFCGACRAVIVNGKAEYLTEPIAACAEGEVIICCARSKGITIDL
ncbi:2Fe-2S iron-sulfur cluster-binding protein [Photobacterium ganghwense]|uniref:2Fe-2S iron-sulfur cluster-binding protein n=1 Tax=Photobacterium ganghwense TaxID=320778 RepID=UPI001A9036B8|nr:2Fe-2S iron-sulfur cluster-binding protein [Photobacterium ganghwense]QSV17630.1 2Fe-2S iron-sulfur cluster binding domain-containing protein [Photobacterium ganghwense]